MIEFGILLEKKASRRLEGFYGLHKRALVYIYRRLRIAIAYISAGRSDGQTRRYANDVAKTKQL